MKRRPKPKTAIIITYRGHSDLEIQCSFSLIINKGIIISLY